MIGAAGRGTLEVKGPGIDAPHHEPAPCGAGPKPGPLVLAIIGEAVVDPSKT